MPVKVVNFTAKVCNETKTVTMQNLMRDTITFKILNNPFALLEIPEVEKKLLPTLKEMYPEWFTYNEEDLRDTVKKLFDQVENAMLEAKPKDDCTSEEQAYLEGFESCLEFAQQEMLWIEKKLKEGENPFDYAKQK